MKLCPNVHIQLLFKFASIKKIKIIVSLKINFGNTDPGMYEIFCFNFSSSDFIYWSVL